MGEGTRLGFWGRRGKGRRLKGLAGRCRGGGRGEREGDGFGGERVGFFWTRRIFSMICK